MYNLNYKAMQSLNEFLELLKSNISVFIRYFLYVILLLFFVFLIVLILMFATCCLMGCIFSIPILGSYIAAVVLLPIHIFFRIFPLELLSQIDNKYDLKILKNSAINIYQ